MAEHKAKLREWDEWYEARESESDEEDEEDEEEEESEGEGEEPELEVHPLPGLVSTTSGSILGVQTAGRNVLIEDLSDSVVQTQRFNVDDPLGHSSEQRSQEARSNPNVHAADDDGSNNVGPSVAAPGLGLGAPQGVGGLGCGTGSGGTSRRRSSAARDGPFCCGCARAGSVERPLQACASHSCCHFMHADCSHDRFHCTHCLTQQGNLSRPGLVSTTSGQGSGGRTANLQTPTGLVSTTSGQEAGGDLRDVLSTLSQNISTIVETNANMT